MIYGMYRGSRNASWQCLLDFNVRTVPVMLSPIMQKIGIKIIKNSTVNELKYNECGATIFDGNLWYIIYDDRQEHRRYRFTIAHELGHIVLGHELSDGYYKRSNVFFDSKPSIESEADNFAARLLAPACVLWKLNLRTAREISEFCNISYSAGLIREERMRELFRRNKFLISPLERQVFNNFEPFINEELKRRYGSDFFNFNASFERRGY